MALIILKWMTKSTTEMRLCFQGCGNFHPDTRVESHHTQIQLKGISTYVFGCEKRRKKEEKKEKKKNIRLMDSEYATYIAIQ